MRHRDVARDAPPNPQRLRPSLRARDRAARESPACDASCAGVRSVASVPGACDEADRELLGQRFERARELQGQRRIGEARAQVPRVDPRVGVNLDADLDLRRRRRGARETRASGAAPDRRAPRRATACDRCSRSISARAAASRQKKTRWQSTRRPFRRLGCSSDAAHLHGDAELGEARDDPVAHASIRCFSSSRGRVYAFDVARSGRYASKSALVRRSVSASGRRAHEGVKAHDDRVRTRWRACHCTSGCQSRPRSSAPRGAAPPCAGWLLLLRARAAPTLAMPPPASSSLAVAESPSAPQPCNRQPARGRGRHGPS